MAGNTFQPLKRAGKPRDIGEAAAYLADDETAGFVTGTNLIVDGGIVAGMAGAAMDEASSKQQEMLAK